MTPVLPPELALAWLRSLSTDVRATAILDAEGAVLAGDAALGARAAAGDPAVTIIRAAGSAVAVEPGPRALRRLLELDARTALALLEP